MANCKISAGMTFTCDDKKGSVSGFANRLWIGNKADLDASVGVKGLTFGVSGDVTDITMLPTTGLYEYGVLKDSISLNIATKKVEGSKVMIEPVTVEFNILDNTSAQKASWRTLANADSLFVILERISGEFVLVGTGFGLEVIDGSDKMYGKLPTENASRKVVLKSEGELVGEYIFFDTDYATTFAKIEAKVL